MDDKHTGEPREQTNHAADSIRSQQEAFLASIVNSLQDSVVSVSLDGIVTSWNPAATALYGYTAEEAIGKPLSALTLPEEVAGILSDIQTIGAGRQVPRYNTVRLHKDGRTIDIEVQLSPVTDPGGAVMGVSAITRDITPLRKTEQRLLLISDAIPQIVWENDCNGKAIYFNQRWYEYSGKTFEQSEGPGWPVISHVDDNYSISAWKEALESGTLFESKARLRRADGLYQWHLLRNMPLKDAAGNVLGWYGTATNIEELVQNESSLTAITQKLRSILEAATDFAIISLDENGFITDWNSGAELLFQYSRQEAAGKYTDIIFTEEDRYGRIPEAEIEIARSTGRSIDERWHVRRDGSRFFMSGVMTPIYNGGITGYVKVARNITDRKMMEEALFQSEQRNNLMLQSSQIGEWEWNGEEDVFSLSDMSLSLIGLKAGHRHIAAQEMLHLIHPDDRPMVLERIRAALDGLNYFQAEFRLGVGDETDMVWLNGYGRVIAHREGKPVKMIGVVYDITDRKIQEKQKDDFIGVASHELKTPVTIIRTYTEVLLELFEDANQPHHAELLRKMDIQVDRLAQLIHNLLDITNIAEGKIRLFPEIFDLNQLIGEQVDEFRMLNARRSIEWQPANIPAVHGDRQRLRQVVVNFISNAIKYSSADSNVIVSTEDDLDGVIVRVRDFGRGIPKKEQHRIFHRYYRASDKEISSYPGLGLGLYISAEIIRQHLGSIGVESEPGIGSTFYFKIPYS